MNICMVGYGMMGTWHSDALKDRKDCHLYMLVGRRPEPAQEFAARYGYQKWTINLAEAFADPAVDVVILANPTEQHAATALASIAAGKPTLVEIPIAMTLADSEKVVAAAKAKGVMLGVVHPMRMRPPIIALRERMLAGEEYIRHVNARFFLHRLENVGITGYRRSWTDNLLWHHTTHLLDYGLWLLNTPVRKVNSFMPSLDPHTGIPMEVVLGIETETDQSFAYSGSYYSHERIYEALVVTNRDSYRVDVFQRTLTTGAGMQTIETEQENCMAVTRDFVEAVQQGRAPAVTGESVLPAMRVLQQAQDQWDAIHGVQSIPGRELAYLNA